MRKPPAELLALIAVAAFIVAFGITPIGNNDVFLHLKTGETILETGTVPRVDDFSALARGNVWIAHEWLSAVLFDLVARAGGLDGLIVLKAGVALAVAALLYAAARTLGAAPIVAIPALILVMLLAAARFMERPHIFSYAMTAVFLLLLARRRTGKRAPIWLFLPVESLWTNLHGGFVLGPALVVLAAAGEAIDSLFADARGGEKQHHRLEAARLAALATVLAFVPLINPYGTALLGFVFSHTASAYTEWIYEWQPPFQSAFRATYMMRYYVVWMVAGALVLLAAGVRAIRRREPLPCGSLPFLLFPFFLALSMRMNRNVTDFALATLPGLTATATGLLAPRIRTPQHRRALLGIGALTLLLAAWLVVYGYPYSPTNRRPFGFGLRRGAAIPVEATDYLAAIGIRGNGFNSYDSGAYLIYRLYPDVRVAMDSRNLHTEEQYREYTRALGDGRVLQSMLGQIDATFVLLAWRKAGLAAARLLRQLGGWSLVYFDDDTVVYLPEKGPLSAVVERDRYRVLDPTLYIAGKLRPSDAAAALAEADRAARGGAWIARLMRIEALSSLGRREEALEEERRILASDPEHDACLNLAVLRFTRGDPPGAEELFRRALELRPGSRAAQQWLRYLAARTPKAPQD
ncbi:MAG: hypothetical protein ACREQQ_09275 [Candidatus Binatia bacterium]